MIRGGTYSYDSHLVRSAWRDGYADERGADIGLRLVRMATAVQR